MTLENQHDEMEARLSAYAFGELEGEELAEMEARVAADPLLAVRVAELRAFGDELGAVLKDEPAPAGTAALHAASAAAGFSPPPDASGERVLRFPAWAWAAAGFAAAAGVAVVVSLRQAELPGSGGERQVGAASQKKPASTLAPTPLAPPMPTPVPPPAKLTPASEGLLTDAGLGKRSQAKADAELSAMAPVVSFEVQLDAAKKAFAEESGAKWTGVSGSAAKAPSTSAMTPAVGRLFADKTPPAPAEAPVGGMMLAGYAPSAPVPERGGYAFAETRRANLAAIVSVSDLHGAFGATEPQGSESYAGVRESGFVTVESAPLSTFSVDVDTAGYANLRRFIQNGQRPPRDAVRVEALINYFPYRYAPPPSGSEAPFAANLAVSSAPWAPTHRLVRVGIKGREFAPEARPAANLVFLIDVSGSMSSANKLPLVKNSLRQLLGQLRADDRVAIVTYAGASGLALPSTPVSRRGEILESLDRLESGGSTNGGMGIHLAYDIAKANYRPEGVNRVILCTDGDFNVGVAGRGELLSLIQEKARARVFLTVLGFGMGNLKDATLEMLADKGNGAYGYIDSEREARKIFVEQVHGTLATIAKDVKIQVEFNPARVASYRLIGYENRALAKEDFNNDKVDAGEVGAGHTVTALYEIVPVGAATAGDDAEEARPEVDSLKYGVQKKATAPVRRPSPPVPPAGGGAETDELLTVKIRYKAPEGDVSRKLEFPLVDNGAAFASAGADFKFAAAVAAWGMLLRESPHAGSATYADVLAWAEDGLVADPDGHRAEFVELVRRTQAFGVRE